MGVFHFPIHGFPRDSELARSARKPYLATSDGRIYRPLVSVRVGRVPGTFLGHPRYRSVDLQLDSGADCCILAQGVADSIGLARPADAYVEEFKTAGGRVAAWFADVRLWLGYPTDSNQFAWTATVGFVPDDALPVALPSGVLGVGGGLERFLLTELILSPGGVEMPVVRIFTPD